MQDDAVLIDLPEIEEINLGTMLLIDILKKRRSHRDYSDENLSLDELVFLCWSVAGVREVHPNKFFTKRYHHLAGLAIRLKPKRNMS